VPVRVAVMLMVCAGKGWKTCFPLFFFFFSSAVNRTAPGRRQRHRKPVDKGGYGLRIPSTPNTPIVAASRYSPRIITTDKDKKRNVPDSGNVTSASRLPKYRNGLPLPASSAYHIFQDVYLNFLPFDYVTFLDSM